jgi:MFS family permease
MTAPALTRGSPAADVEAYRQWAQRRALRALVVAQIFGGAGLAAGISVGALLARDLLGSTSSAGLPAALFTAGSAGAAVGVGRLSQRYGRRAGLAAGFGVGAVGGASVVVAAVTGNVPLLLAALLLYGAGTATNLQCRYAGADLAEPSHRSRAVSTVLVATTIGAVAGPNLLGVTGALAEAAGLPRLSGPFVLASAAYALASIVLAALLRPDPLLTARRLAEEPPLDPLPSDHPGYIGALPDSNDAPPTGRRTLVLAASGMVIAQAVMVAVMTMTPVHLGDHQHGLSAIGLIIGLHIAAMYLPSPLAGRFVDTYSPGMVTSAGGVVLVVSALVAAAADSSAIVLGVALLLLGLGWNLSLIGGTATVTALTTLDDRARTQGNVDVGVALAGALGGLASGMVVAATSFRMLGLAAASLAVVVVAGAAAAGRSRAAAAG